MDKDIKNMDSIVEITKKISKDPRKDILNLCLGYYRSEENQDTGFSVINNLLTPTFDKSEIKLSVLGDISFRNNIVSLLRRYMLDSDHYMSAIQSLGGSGGLWLCFKTLYQSNLQTVWYSEPGWDNHGKIANNVGMRSKTYNYIINNIGQIESENILSDLEDISESDILVLHGCCHNPCGVDLDETSLKNIAKLSIRKKFYIVVDLAYWGIKNGLKEDLYILSVLSKYLDQFYVVISLSKNTGLYNERLGALILFSKNKNRLSIFENNIKSVIRTTYSMPPSLIAQCVAKVFNNKDLFNKWNKELINLSNTLKLRRRELINKLKELNIEYVLKIKNNSGMFMNFNLYKDEIELLAEKHGIYILYNGRASIASLQLKDIDRLVYAISDCIRDRNFN